MTYNCVPGSFHTGVTAKALRAKIDRKSAISHQRGHFDPKFHVLRLKKVCYKVSLCENCQRQSCKAFISLTNRAKIIGGGRPLVSEILDQSDRVGAKSTIFDLYSLVAPQP